MLRGKRGAGDEAHLDNGKDSGLDEQETKSVEEQPIKQLNGLKNEMNPNLLPTHAATTTTTSIITTTTNGITTAMANCCGEDDDYENDELADGQCDSDENNGLNGSMPTSLEADSEEAKVESVSLTGYDGQKFVASYLVVMTTSNNVSSFLNELQCRVIMADQTSID